MARPSLRPVLFGLALILCSPLMAQVPSPKAILGHDIGEDYFLANYTQLRTYWDAVAKASDRVHVESIGQTSYGLEHVIAVVTSPANHKKLKEYRAISRRLARAKGLSDDEARALAAEGKAVVWIDGGLHSTETIAGQNIIELVYRMASGTDEETKEILDNVILLVCPANPDGMEMVANAYMATRSTRTPVLYQRYVGHDNNRDFYAVNQQEAWNINRCFYEVWYPQIVYNHHQSAPRGTIIFTPPFRDPFNYRYDPLVVRGIELVSAHMNQRFSREQKPGVISRTGASYSTWWNGGLRTTVYFHNIIGILTEVFGSPTPTRVTQRLTQRVPYSDYPDPIGSQEWHARQTIEYLQTANRAILTYAARYRRELLEDVYRMAANSVERGSRDHWTPTPTMMDMAKAAGEGSRAGDAGNEVWTKPELRDPRGFILSANQPDMTAVARFLRSLQKGGVEVLQATKEFTVGGKIYPKDSFVVRCDQAYRPHILDMFEPQDHPDDVAATGEPIRPYDSAGWTLAYQAGVEFDRILDGFDGPFEAITWAQSHRGRFEGAKGDDAEGFLIDHRDVGSFLLVNRMLAEDLEVFWLDKAWNSNNWRGRAGDIWVKGKADLGERMRQLAFETDQTIVGVTEKPSVPMTEIRPVRIGLFDVYGGNMPTGWAQWVLNEFGFPVQLVFGERVNRGDLKNDYDVLVFLTGLPGGRDLRSMGRNRPIKDETLEKLQEALPAFEDWSSLRERSVRLNKDSWGHLRKFVEDGGSLVTIGGEAGKAIRAFELPLLTQPMVKGEDGEMRRLSRDEFFIPGSLVALDVDTSVPGGYGLAPRQGAMFRRSAVFLPEGEMPASIQTIATYAEKDTLMSGWAIGEQYIGGKAAAMRADVGKGHVYLFGPSITYRGQPIGTFKLLFNAIHQGNSR